MTETRVMTADLRAAIEHSGYYPGLVTDAVASALGAEPVTAFFVLHDAIFDPGMEVRRHMTVMALTPTRLVYSHTDEHPAESPESEGRVSAIMATYWRDVDAAWERAVRAGAEVIYPLADQFYGERGGRLRDPFGQQWMLSHRIEQLSGEELEQRARSFFSEGG